MPQDSPHYPPRRQMRDGDAFRGSRAWIVNSEDASGQAPQAPQAPTPPAYPPRHSRHAAPDAYQPEPYADPAAGYQGSDGYGYDQGNYADPGYADPGYAPQGGDYGYEAAGYAADQGYGYADGGQYGAGAYEGDAPGGHDPYAAPAPAPDAADTQAFAAAPVEPAAPAAPAAMSYPPRASRAGRHARPAAEAQPTMAQAAVPVAAPAPAAAAPTPPPAAPGEPPSRRNRKGKQKKPVRFDPIAAFGDLLVTVGVILALFAFWQVYVTDWQVASATQQQVSVFDKSAQAVPDKISTDERKTAPPAVPTTPYGQVMGALHVPRWNYMVIPVREGTGSDVLDTGAAGHYPTTAMPGAIGNFSVAAHRRSYGSNFRRIDKLTDGDVVIMETKDAWLVYKYQSHEIVSPQNGNVILPVPNQPNVEPTQRLMTMTTCHPEYGNSQRFIVHLTFDHWVPRNSGIPKELAEAK